MIKEILIWIFEKISPFNLSLKIDYEIFNNVHEFQFVYHDYQNPRFLYVIKTWDIDQMPNKNYQAKA